jgi:radical SAM superfamily enzyme YgiQ (UPF0313 family)
MTDRRAILVAMSGVRVYNQELLALGLTLPGFVERSKVIASLPSLGLLTIAAHTPPNWDVSYEDVDELTDDFIETLIHDRPDVVAVSSLTARIRESYKLSDRLREAGITTVVGGLHATALPRECAEHFDAVVQGDGETHWPQLLQDFETGKLRSIYTSGTMHKLEDARIPRYDLLDFDHYNRITIQTTRGCPLDCAFCAASRLLGPYRRKPMEQVERELQSILDQWPRPFIELADDNTFVNKTWSKQLLHLFKRYPLKWFTETDVSIADDPDLLDLLAESNCAQVLIGFESATPESLVGIDRNDWKRKRYDQYLDAIDTIQSRGISVNGCFVLGFDADTPDTFEQTRDFILASGLTETQITILTPFPGTRLYGDLKQQNRLLKDAPWEQCTLFDLTFQPANFSVHEFNEAFAQLMHDVYAPSVVAERRRHFRDLRKNRNQSTTL